MLSTRMLSTPDSPDSVEPLEGRAEDSSEGTVIESGNAKQGPAFQVPQDLAVVLAAGFIGTAQLIASGVLTNGIPN